MTDPRNSDNVTITIDRATDHLSRDSAGDVRSDMTYHIDPDRRSHNVLHGHIADGVLYTEPADIRILADPYLIPEYRWTRARLKLKLNDDGSVKGILGGYHDWNALYWAYASGGWVDEHAVSLDIPAYWYSLKRNADADPDPQTGENRSISTAFEVEAVPAFVLPAERRNRARVSEASPSGPQMAAGDGKN